jgi:P-type E1-E2 ATPase
VPEAVQNLRKAGITTHMITGDNYNTARNIGLEAKILLDDKSKD